MSAANKWQVVTELKESTMNLTGGGRSKVNKDCSPNAAQRQEKVAFVEDYIDREATMSNLYQLLEKCIFFFFRTGSFESSTNFVRLASSSNLESNKQAPGAEAPGAKAPGAVRSMQRRKISLLQRRRERTPLRRITTLMEKTMFLLMDQPRTKDHAMKKQVVVVEEEKMQVVVLVEKEKMPVVAVNKEKMQVVEEEKMQVVVEEEKTCLPTSCPSFNLSCWQML